MLVNVDQDSTQESCTTIDATRTEKSCLTVTNIPANVFTSDKMKVAQIDLCTCKG
jgi:hypothetical protein